MTRDRLVVTLSYYFPPLVGIASERAVTRAETLRRLGWDVAVVTVREGHYHSVAGTESFAFPVIRTPSVELSRVIRRAYAAAGAHHTDTGPNDGTLRPVATGSLGARLRRWVREWVYIPDAQVGWVPFAAAGAMRAARGRDAVIVSTSVPYSAHVAAYLTAKRLRAPWIAELRDPWSTAAESLLPSSRSRRRLDRALERFLLARADHVIVTSATTRSNLLLAHPMLAPERVSVVMNGFVPSSDGPRPAPHEPCCFVFAGTVSDGEDPAALLSAFARVEARSPGRFRLRVLGPAEPWTTSASETPKWLELVGVVTPAAARAAIMESNATILLQHHPGRAQVLSGKAFEYIGARRPILAVVQPESEMAAILRRYADARLLPSYDLEPAVQELEGLIAEHRAGALEQPSVERESIQELTRDGQAAILDEILMGLEHDR